jgi:hypothetical protein
MVSPQLSMRFGFVPIYRSDRLQSVNLSTGRERKTPSHGCAAAHKTRTDKLPLQPNREGWKVGWAVLHQQNRL